MDTSLMPKDPPSASEPVEVTPELATWAKQLDLLDYFLSKPSLLGTHYPAYGWGASDDDISGETQIQIQRTMEAIAHNTTSGQFPAIFDLLLAAHIHLAQVTSFEEEGRAAQLVVANSGTQFVAPVEPPNEIGELHVRDTYAVYQYGYVVMTSQKGEDGMTKEWKMDFKDRMGIVLRTCYLEGKQVFCGNAPWEDDK